ncbi:hypothetical protein [Azospirillum sp. sgz302134]
MIPPFLSRSDVEEAKQSICIEDDDLPAEAMTYALLARALDYMAASYGEGAAELPTGERRYVMEDTGLARWHQMLGEFVLAADSPDAEATREDFAVPLALAQESAAFQRVADAYMLIRQEHKLPPTTAAAVVVLGTLNFAQQQGMSDRESALLLAMLWAYTQAQQKDHGQPAAAPDMEAFDDAMAALGEEPGENPAPIPTERSRYPSLTMVLDRYAAAGDRPSTPSTVGARKLNPPTLPLSNVASLIGTGYGHAGHAIRNLADRARALNALVGQILKFEKTATVGIFRNIDDSVWLLVDFLNDDTCREPEDFRSAKARKAAMRICKEYGDVVGCMLDLVATVAGEEFHDLLIWGPGGALSVCYADYDFPEQLAAEMRGNEAPLLVVGDATANTLIELRNWMQVVRAEAEAKAEKDLRDIGEERTSGPCFLPLPPKMAEEMGWSGLTELRAQAAIIREAEGGDVVVVQRGEAGLTVSVGIHATLRPGSAFQTVAGLRAALAITSQHGELIGALLAIAEDHAEQPGLDALVLHSAFEAGVAIEDCENPAEMAYSLSLGAVAVFGPATSSLDLHMVAERSIAAFHQAVGA